MKYKCIRGVVTSKGAVSPGDIIDLSVSEAGPLMGYGKLIPHHEDEITTNAVEDIVHRDPVLRRGRKPKYVA